MAQSHLIALRAQELSALLRASNAPQFASSLVPLPASSVDQFSPVGDALSTPAVFARGALAKYEGGLL